jgi:hypothetical protein
VRRPPRLRIALALLLLAALLIPAASSAAPAEQTVEGLVYDGWCGMTDASECPSEPFPECELTFGCHRYRPVDVEGLFVYVRRQGSAKVIDTLVATEGHFTAGLRPGRYVFRAIAPEEFCLAGQAKKRWFRAGVTGPFYLPVSVHSEGTWSAARGECIQYNSNFAPP